MSRRFMAHRPVMPLGASSGCRTGSWGPIPRHIDSTGIVLQMLTVRVMISCGTKKGAAGVVSDAPGRPLSGKGDNFRLEALAMLSPNAVRAGDRRSRSRQRARPGPSFQSAVREAATVLDSWDDDQLLAVLGDAGRAGQTVPDAFVEMGKGAYAATVSTPSWRNLPLTPGRSGSRRCGQRWHPSGPSASPRLTCPWSSKPPRTACLAG